jgi:U3 small nucleolar RNA-associated protein 5
MIILLSILMQTTFHKRYAEGTNVAVGSGIELGLVNRLEDGTFVDGELNVDLAELSLGQRLTATAGEDKMVSGSDKYDSDSGRMSKKSQEKTKSDVVPANSLTRTLIQALHSSDSGLLETCLAHSDPALISNTVKRLPVQFAVPLITACTDRLGRGARSANLKGRGGGASSQRGSTLVVWIRTVLAMHGGYLMTVSIVVIF